MPNQIPECQRFPQLTSGSALADSSENSGSESREPLLRPTTVVSTSGNVTNADALVEDHEGRGGNSLAHGWASGPTSALSKYVLGVRPVQPGYKTWLVEPQPGDLSWATGTVPTPYGPIAIGWKKDGVAFSLELLVPAGTSGTVGVPVNAGGALLRDNGQTVTGVSAAKEPNGRAGYLYLQDLKPGAHLIQVAGGEK